MSCSSFYPCFPNYHVYMLIVQMITQTNSVKTKMNYILIALNTSLEVKICPKLSGLLFPEDFLKIPHVIICLPSLMPTWRPCLSFRKISNLVGGEYHDSRQYSRLSGCSYSSTLCPSSRNLVSSWDQDLILRPSFLSGLCCYS